MSLRRESNLGLIFDIEAEEEWNYSAPKRGDHIRVSRTFYYHHGVYISDDDVIHFTGQDSDNVLDWSQNEVIQTSLDDFLRGGRLEVKEYTEFELEDLYPVEHIVHYAKGCLGDQGYHLIINNCEHFANMCTLGRFRSRQVERFFKLLLPAKTLPMTRRNRHMGFLGRIGDAWNALWGKGSSGGGSRTSTNNTYTYEPDKVKIAEIEADTKIRLANYENERIEILKNARLDLMEFEVKSTMAIEEAKAKGLDLMAQTLVAMQAKLNEVAEKRIEIIERGSLQIVHDIESFYEELTEKVETNRSTYNREKLPELLSLLNQYKEGTPAFNLYYDQIQKDKLLQEKFLEKQIDSIQERQKQVISGFLNIRERIIEQNDKITAGVLESIKHGNEQLRTLGHENADQLKLESKSVTMIEGK
ncbi:lecithin retinol acyltransferase family protein [Neobacillus drentensis]|uniref:lecithin retinol acyltransferase family protein n=1 Tax=Neobacillus drentensis TaxID=220684 RepID=UPI0030015A33